MGATEAQAVSLSAPGVAARPTSRRWANGYDFPAVADGREEIARSRLLEEDCVLGPNPTELSEDVANLPCVTRRVLQRRFADEEIAPLRVIPDAVRGELDYRSQPGCICWLLTDWDQGVDARDGGSHRGFVGAQSVWHIRGSDALGRSNLNAVPNQLWKTLVRVSDLANVVRHRHAAHPLVHGPMPFLRHGDRRRQTLLPFCTDRRQHCRDVGRNGPLRARWVAIPRYRQSGLQN